MRYEKSSDGIRMESFRSSMFKAVIYENISQTTDRHDLNNKRIELLFAETDL